jgi:P4 family phage/plasmid primase-like protien
MEKQEEDSSTGELEEDIEPEDDSDTDTSELRAELRSVIEAAIAGARAGDVTAAYRAETLAAFAAIRASDLGEYVTLRSELKRACPTISLTEFDTAIKVHRKRKAPQTHHSFAKQALTELTVRGRYPVYYEGALYVVDPNSSLWVPKEESGLYEVITRRNDGHKLCSKEDDYRGIMSCMYAVAGKKAFFAQAPIGIASSQGFYRVSGTEIKLERLTPGHRQRVRIGFEVRQQETPLFDGFLDETFRSEDPQEAQQQKRLVQEIAGAIMLGIMHKYQKAVLFFDPYGRAGKGTLESILRHLVPASFVAAVSPFNWNKEYYLMSLAGARLNVVGELADDQPLPGAQFKSVIGLDPQTGRNPAGRPVVFTCEAAHVFMSNHLINTRDHSEAFFERWLIVEFPNSRLKFGLPIDPDIASRIVQDELPGIAHWALEGAQRLLSQGRFSGSKAHDRLMAKWRRTSSSLEEFINECCVLGDKLKIKRKDFYEQYRRWCKANGRIPFASPKLKEMLASNVKLGVRCVEIKGYETFKGVGPKESEWDAIGDIGF